MPLTLQQRLERIGYSAEQAINAVMVHTQAGKLFDLEQYVAVKEEILEVLG